MKRNMGIKYRRGYKYQLAEDYTVQTGIIRNMKPRYIIETEFITLFPDGTLFIRKGYACDGASGPAIDTKNIMRGAFIHDALYQLLRQGHLHIERREQADKELKRICLEDGMSKVRAWWVYRGVRRFAKFAALPENKKKILEAP